MSYSIVLSSYSSFLRLLYPVSFPLLVCRPCNQLPFSSTLSLIPYPSSLSPFLFCPSPSHSSSFISLPVLSSPFSPAPLLSSLSELERSHCMSLASKVTFECYSKGSEILKAGGTEAKFLIILQGQAKVTQTHTPLYLSLSWHSLLSLIMLFALSYFPYLFSLHLVYPCFTSLFPLSSSHILSYSILSSPVSSHSAC